MVKSGSSAEEARRQRAAEALRANLRRRKAQARARAASESESDAAPSPTEPDGGAASERSEAPTKRAAD